MGKKNSRKQESHKKKNRSKQPQPSLKLYRRIAVGFVVLVVSLLLLVLFVSTVSTTISITPSEHIVESEFLVDIVPMAVTEGKIKGVVSNAVYEKAKTFPAEGVDQKEVIGKSGGMVTIYNETTNNQPLVATTRLLTPDDILFRIDEGVMVPAGGSVEVMAHADEEGGEGDIGTSHFTIPGLATSLQTAIYAESMESMMGGLTYVSIISEEDLDLSSSSLQEEMLAEVKADLLEQAGEYSEQIFTYEILEKISDTEPEAEADEYTISISLSVTGVFFDTDELKRISEAKLYEKIKKGNELVALNLEDINYEVQKYDIDQEMATMRVRIIGASIVSATNVVLDKQTFIGLSEREIEEILMVSDIAEKVRVEFFPPWIQRAPSLKDHIYIIIEDR